MKKNVAGSDWNQLANLSKNSEGSSWGAANKSAGEELDPQNFKANSVHNFFFIEEEAKAQPHSVSVHNSTSLLRFSA